MAASHLGDDLTVLETPRQDYLALKNNKRNKNDVGGGSSPNNLLVSQSVDRTSDANSNSVRKSDEPSSLSDVEAGGAGISKKDKDEIMKRIDDLSRQFNKLKKLHLT